MAIEVRIPTILRTYTSGAKAVEGSGGTLDELIEILTWQQLGLHGKPIALLDVGGFWDGLLAFADSLVTAGFVAPASRAGLVLAREWRRARATEVMGLQRGLEKALADRPGGFELLACGGFFGWIRHPFAGRGTGAVARDLITRYDTLVMSGTAFLPDDRQVLRVSFANVDLAGLTEFAGRLELMAQDARG